MCSRAVILAGGQGTRLRPYTVVLPKPLVPVGQYPIVEILVRQLAARGIRQITIAVGYHANLIQAFFGDGRQWNVQVDYSLESKPLGTIGPLRLIPDLPETFLLMNGDILTDLDFADLCRHHQASGCRFTVAASARRHTIDYGVLKLDGNRLVGFEEKPSVEYHVSMGVYVVNREVLSLVPPDQPYGFDALMLELLRRGDPVNIYPHQGYWLDIGRPDDYAQAVEEFPKMEPRLLGHV